MVMRDELQAYLAHLLAADIIKDYAPNGLQVEGQVAVNFVVSGVSANQALIEQAIALKADTILVHHGFFWRGENPCLLGVKKKRLQLLLQHDINCFGYHLPLDVHLTYGNNVALADRLDITVDRWLKVESGLALVGVGHLSEPLSATDFSKKITQVLQRAPLLIKSPLDQPIKKVAWCTGAAQDYLELAATEGVDAFVTGEVSERTTALARELGIHFYAAGHHATESDGVRLLGEHLADHFSIRHQFVDIENPV